MKLKVLRRFRMSMFTERGWNNSTKFKYVGSQAKGYDFFSEDEVLVLKEDDGTGRCAFKTLSGDATCNDGSNWHWLHLDDVEPIEKENKAIESDGGSSDYYFTKLPLHIIDQIILTGGIEIKDIARYVYDNDADAFNIIKAEKRIIEAKKGKGKAGIDMLYDMNKIVFFANEQYEAIKREGTNE